MKYFLNFVWVSKLTWMRRKITEKIDEWKHIKETSFEKISENQGICTKSGISPLF